MKLTPFGLILVGLGAISAVIALLNPFTFAAYIPIGIIVLFSSFIGISIRSDISCLAFVRRFYWKYVLQRQISTVIEKVTIDTFGPELESFTPLFTWLRDPMGAGLIFIEGGFKKLKPEIQRVLEEAIKTAFEKLFNELR